MADYILSGESTMDYPYEEIAAKNIPFIKYVYEVDGVDYEDDMGKDPAKASEFYSFIDAGKIPNTSQINQFRYEEYFRELLKEGKDIIHVCLGTGMTGSYNNAVNAAEELKEEYPERKLYVIDSLCSCQGFGLLVSLMNEQKEKGLGIDELNKWALDNRLSIQHFFTTEDLKYFKRTGRLSGPAATLGAMLNILPVMRLDKDGKMQAYDKVRGKKKAFKHFIEEALKTAKGGADYEGPIIVGDARNKADAELIKNMLTEAFPKVKDIEIMDIGPVIASHCGPGTVSFYFVGADRK